MQPARLKDVFLRFNNQKDKYSCFVFFNEEEIETLLEVLSSKNIEKVLLENADYDSTNDKRTVDDNLFN